MATQRQDEAHADSGESAEDLRGKEFCFCTRQTDAKIALCGAGEKVSGVISEGRDTGYHTSFNFGVVLKVIAGGAVTAGDEVQSDASGHAVTGSSNPAGLAINSAAQGEMVEVQFGF